MQCFIPTQPAQESLTSNKSHSATVFLASQPGWWLFSHCKHVVRCLDIQCHATLLSASLATHFWLCTQRKLSVFPQCPILLLGKSVHKELWWELEEMFVWGSYSPLHMDFLLQYWDLCLLAVFYAETRFFSKGRTQRRDLVLGAQSRVYQEPFALSTHLPYLSVSLQCHCLIHCFHL